MITSPCVSWLRAASASSRLAAVYTPSSQSLSSACSPASFRRSRSDRRGSVRCVLAMRRRRRRVEGQPRRRRVGGEGAHRLEAAHLQRVQALAQRRFERGFPAGLDVHLRPQALQAVEPVLGQPGLELALGLHLVLQRAQRLEPRAPGRPGASASLLAAVLPRAALLVERRHLLAPARAAAPRPAPAPALRRRAVALQLRPAAAASGAARPWRSPASRSRRCCSWRACSSTLRLSAASTWICCCTSATAPRCCVAARLRLAQRVFQRRAAAAPASSACAASSCGLLVGRRDRARRCAPARPAPRPGARPMLVLRLQLGQALLRRAARPSTT